MKLEELEKIKETQPGMKHPLMLYKHPGPHKMGKDGMFDYCVVDKCDEKSLDMLLKADWRFTIQGAKKKDSAVEKAAVSKLECEKAIAEEAKEESDEDKKSIEEAEKIATEALEKADAAEKEAARAKAETEKAIKEKEEAEKELAKSKPKTPAQIKAEADKRMSGGSK